MVDAARFAHRHVCRHLCRLAREDLRRVGAQVDPGHRIAHMKQDTGRDTRETVRGADHNISRIQGGHHTVLHGSNRGVVREPVQADDSIGRLFVDSAAHRLVKCHSPHFRCVQFEGLHGIVSRNDNRIRFCSCPCGNDCPSGSMGRNNTVLYSNSIGIVAAPGDFGICR